MDKLSGTSHLQWYHPANLKPWNKVKANAHFSSQMAPLCELLREYLCATLLQSCCVIVYAANCAQSWLLVKLPTSVNCTHGETQSKARLLYNSNTIDLYTYTTHSAHHKYKTWWHLHRHNDRKKYQQCSTGRLTWQGGDRWGESAAGPAGVYAYLLGAPAGATTVHNRHVLSRAPSSI